MIITPSGLWPSPPIRGENIGSLIGELPLRIAGGEGLS